MFLFRTNELIPQRYRLVGELDSLKDLWRISGGSLEDSLVEDLCGPLQILQCRSDSIEERVRSYSIWYWYHLVSVVLKGIKITNYDWNSIINDDFIIECDQMDSRLVKPANQTSGSTNATKVLNYSSDWTKDSFEKSSCSRPSVFKYHWYNTGFNQLWCNLQLYRRFKMKVSDTQSDVYAIISLR